MLPYLQPLPTCNSSATSGKNSKKKKVRFCSLTLTTIQNNITTKQYNPNN